MEKIWSEFTLTIVVLVWHDWFFRDTHFIAPLELKANDSLKHSIEQEVNKLINIFLINPNIWYPFLSNIYEYQKYHQHQYYHNRLKNDWHIRIIQSFLYYQMKNVLKHYWNLMELHSFQNLLLWICISQHHQQINIML